jgi:hypothetical protein
MQQNNRLCSYYVSAISATRTNALPHRRLKMTTLGHGISRSTPMDHPNPPHNKVFITFYQYYVADFQPDSPIGTPRGNHRRDPQTAALFFQCALFRPYHSGEFLVHHDSARMHNIAMQHGIDKAAGASAAQNRDNCLCKREKAKIRARARRHTGTTGHEN